MTNTNTEQELEIISIINHLIDEPTQKFSLDYKNTYDDQEPFYYTDLTNFRIIIHRNNTVVIEGKTQTHDYTLIPNENLFDKIANKLKKRTNSQFLNQFIDEFKIIRDETNLYKGNT